MATATASREQTQQVSPSAAAMVPVSFLCKTPQAQRAFIIAAQQAVSTLETAGIGLQPAISALTSLQGSTLNSTSSQDELLAPTSLFDSQRYMSHLTSSTMGHVLLSTADITSTQQFMQQHGATFGPGCVMVADRQSSGKGRGGNSWVSPAGCLMFSCLWSLKVPGTQAPFINYVISLALTRAVRDAVQAVAPGLLEPLDVRIKWPNDIYACGLKIGGILINTTLSQGRFNIVCGVGLNLDNQQPTTCINRLLADALAAQQVQATGSVDQGQGQEEAASQAAVVGDSNSMASQASGRSSSNTQGAGACEPAEAASVSERTAQGGPDAAAGAATSRPASNEGAASGLVSRELLLACIMNQLEECFEVFEVSGFAPLQEEYLASWLHTGQRVLAHDPDLHQPNSQAIEAAGAEGTWLTVCGLSRGGFLSAVDDRGNAYELTPDGNSLDMMQGLIKRKVLGS